MKYILSLAFLTLSLSLKGSEGLDKEKIIKTAIALVYSPFDQGIFDEEYLDLAEGNRDLATDYGDLYENRKNSQKITTFCQKWGIPREKIKK